MFEHSDEHLYVVMTCVICYSTIDFCLCDVFRFSSVMKMLSSQHIDHISCMLEAPCSDYTMIRTHQCIQFDLINNINLFNIIVNNENMLYLRPHVSSFFLLLILTFFSKNIKYNFKK